MAKQITQKTKAHTRYKNVEGKVVPSVTTIIGGNLGWNKGALIGWSRKMALQGIDPNKERDEAADIGTLAHALMEEHITLTAPHLEPVLVDKDLYSPVNLAKAEVAFLAFLSWVEQYNVDLTDPRVQSEVRLVSEWLQYGGTLDLIAPVDDILSLVDFKSTNALYAEHRIQLAAYEWLYEETYGEMIPTHLLQVSKDEGDFHHHSFADLSNEMEIFRLLARLHQLHKVVK
jgi:hypothetical protein